MAYNTIDEVILHMLCAAPFTVNDDGVSATIRMDLWDDMGPKLFDDKQLTIYSEIHRYMSKRYEEENVWEIDPAAKALPGQTLICKFRVETRKPADKLVIRNVPIVKDYIRIIDIPNKLEDYSLVNDTHFLPREFTQTLDTARRMSIRKRGVVVVCLAGPAGVGKTSGAIALAKQYNANHVIMRPAATRDPNDLVGYTEKLTKGTSSWEGNEVWRTLNDDSQDVFIIVDEANKISPGSNPVVNNAFLSLLSEGEWAASNARIDFNGRDTAVVVVMTVNNMNNEYASGDQTVHPMSGAMINRINFCVQLEQHPPEVMVAKLVHLGMPEDLSEKFVHVLNLCETEIKKGNVQTNDWSPTMRVLEAFAQAYMTCMEDGEDEMTTFRTLFKTNILNIMVGPQTAQMYTLYKTHYEQIFGTDEDYNV